MKILPDNMYDAVPSLIHLIPSNAKYVGGYVDSVSFTWSAADWAKFPNAVHCTFTTRGLKFGHFADVENGDLTPQQGYNLYQRGGCKGIYCNHSTWPSVINIFTANNKPQPPYFIAQYPGGGRVLPTLSGITAVAHQYINSDPVDQSVVTDTFLALITGKTVLDDDMALSDKLPPVKLGDGSEYTLTVGDVLRGLAQYIGGDVAEANTTAHPLGQYVSRILSISDIQTAVDTVNANVASIKGALPANQAALLAAVAAHQNGTVAVDVSAADLQAALQAVLGDGFNVAITPK